MKTAEVPVTADFADAAMGYCLHVPCCIRGCENDVAWWGDQHGCTEGAICHEHMGAFVGGVTADLSVYGYALCAYCRGAFSSFGSFVRIRPI